MLIDGLMPIAVYPQKYLNELEDEVEATKAKITSGEQPVFDSVDASLAKLEDN